MTTAEHLLSVYLSANIALIIATVIWCLAKRIFAQTSLRTAYQTQLHLLYGLVAMVVLTPLAFMTLDMAEQWGAVPGQSGLNFTDFLVAQYLHGNIAMQPTEFERLLMWRTQMTQSMASLSHPVSIGAMGALLGGFALIVLRNARDTLRLIRLIRGSYVLRRMGHVDIRFTHETRVPFSTRGLFRHYIVLPTDLLAQQDDVRIAVSHELQHVRQNDLTWEIALELVRPFFFWNPAFAICKRDAEQLRELACDQQVLRRKPYLMKDYCECLLRVCRTALPGDRANQIITPSVPFVQIDRRAYASHSGQFLKRRIVSLLDQQTNMSGQRIGRALVIATLSISLAATLVLRPATNWSHDRLMLSTIVNLERLNSRTITP